MDRRIMMVAEAGVNHNGDLGLALKLCDAAKKAGADVVKFQTFVTDRVVTKDVAQADYQERNTGTSRPQYNMLKQLELPFEDFRVIKKYCDEIGITFASTADDEESLDFLVDLGIPFIKIGSGDVGNVPFLERIGMEGVPVVLSTGMSSLGDVELSVQSLRKGGAESITLLHCTTSYPCPYREANLRAMLTLRDAFHLPVGYSDHTLGTEVAVAAAALGAKMIEKHFTLDPKMAGPDHLASIGPCEFKSLVEKVRNIELALGDGIKHPTINESQIKEVVVKRLVARRRVAKGERLSADNMCVKRSNEGLVASNWKETVGRCANKDYNEDEGIVF